MKDSLGRGRACSRGRCGALAARSGPYNRSMSWQVASVVPVWIAAVVAAVIIGVLSLPEQRIAWVGISLAAAIIATFVIQLAIQRKEGYVVRAMASIGGAIVVLGIASAVFALG